MSVKERLNDFVHFKRMTKKEFGLSIGMDPSYMTSMSKSPSAEAIESIIEIYPELNIDWLYTGRGDMLYTGYYTNISNNSQVHHGNGSQIVGNVVHTVAEELLIKELDLTKELMKEKEKRISVLESLLEMYKLK